MSKMPLAWRGLCLTGMAALLTGCAMPAPQTPPQKLAAPDLRTVDLTVSELRLVEHRAYNAGFGAGRAYERLHPTTPPAPVNLPATSTAAPQPPPQPQKQISPPANTPPPISPTPSYNASGPATPLSTAP